MVIVTTFDLDEYVYGALQAGAVGFVLKDAGPALLVEAVRAANAGDALIVDAVHKDARRCGAAAINIVPTTMGAARATGEVLPHLAGRLDGIALRVPVPGGSMTDLVATLKSEPTADEVRHAFNAAASSGPLVGRLEYADEPLVSSDVVGDPASCIFDAELTMAKGHVVKVLGWYDNEWGYANRLVELSAKVGVAA